MTSIEAASDEPDAWFKLDRDSRKLTVGGAWTIAESARLYASVAFAVCAMFRGRQPSSCAVAS